MKHLADEARGWRRPRRGTLLLLVAALAACGGAARPPRAPRGLGPLAGPLAAAFREEAIGDQAKAVDLYVRALDEAAASTDDGASVAVTMASLDALVHRDIGAFADVTSSSALADRVPPALLEAHGGSVDARLAKAQEHAEGPFSRPLIARARLALAERRGDAKAAAALRGETGCARRAVLVGPVAWMPVSGVHEPSALDAADAPLPREVQGPGPFLPRLRPREVSALGCRIPLTADTSARGVREVIVDIDVPVAGDIGVGLIAPGEATLRVGGAVVVTRRSASGDGDVLKVGRAHVARAGTVRIVARVGMAQDFGTVELDAWDAHGKPLRSRAPAFDTRATTTVTRASEVTSPVPASDDERLASALFALAAHESHTAEDLLYPRVVAPDAPPALLMVYGRAVRLARDLPRTTSTERARGAFDRVLDAWPSAWEAMVERAVLAGVRRGRTEAGIAKLTDLDASRAKTSPSAPALVSAFEAATAGAEHLADRAAQAFERAKGPLAGTPLLRAAERLVVDRTGQELAAFDCDDDAAADRTSLQCHRSRLAAGDRAGADRELTRLQRLAEAPQLYLSAALRSALEAGDNARAAKDYAEMNPGSRLLSALYALRGKAAMADLFALATTARDAPEALPGLLRAAGEDPLAAWDGVAETVTKRANDNALTANAATAVLTHQEKYEVAKTGLVHFTMLDVRRVMGTADVEANAQASGPTLYGRDTTRVLRRRIFKKDGRILLPEETPNAAQAHADLSQLEAGDAIEAIYEGWALPSEMGNIGFDSPDLLPMRTTVQNARIEVRLPADLKGTLWSHASMGAPTERVTNGTRVLVWTLENRPVRRIESGVPKMDRKVNLSYATTTWSDVARGLRETIAELDDRDPELTAWAREAATGKQLPAEIVEAVVAASGKAVKEASGMVLSDVDLGGASAHGTTARTMLATHEGSRTWLIVKALGALGIAANIVVAENEPFSNSPSFPPHLGRFMHPLAVAHVPDPAHAGALHDVWIDADVPGPPLPAGKISPELRGRFALWESGDIRELPYAGSEDERDEVDQRLTVDAEGNAKGVITVLLRGRSAQDLAETLVRLVGDERQRALRDIALAWLPFATVEKVELSSSEGSWQVAIRAELTAPAYAQVEGQDPARQTWLLPGIDPLHYVFPRPYVTTLTATYANRAARENALAINRATQYHMRRRVELPPGAQITRLPGPFDARGHLLTATRKVQVAGSTIEEDFALTVTTGTIPQRDYDAFVLRARDTDDAFRASTQVKPEAKVPEASNKH